MKFNLSLVLLLAIACIQCNSEKAKSNIILTETVKEIPVPDPIPEYIDLNYVMGKFSTENHSKIVKIDSKYADKSGRYMHIEAYQDFKKMHADAAKVGIHLTIKSASRNFDYQKGIWERKWKGATLLEGKIDAVKTYKDPKDRANAILKYSSMPGSSRHHWGTDIDLNSFENAYFEKGKGAKLYNWMLDNASNYGFCQPYTKKGAARPNGYEEEKWHWSYLPVANDCMRLAKKQLRNELINGFLGSEQAVAIDVLNNYILGINKSCLD